MSDRPLAPSGGVPTPLTETATPPLWPLAPFMRAHNVCLMGAQLAARGADHWALTVMVLPRRLDSEVWHDLQAMQLAVIRRCSEQQQDWYDGLAAVADCYHEARRANTLSKAVEQEYDIVARLGALIADRAAKWLELVENIQVSYGYWLTQVLERGEASARPRIPATTRSG